MTRDQKTAVALMMGITVLAMLTVCLMLWSKM